MNRKGINPEHNLYLIRVYGKNVRVIEIKRSLIK